MAERSRSIRLSIPNILTVLRIVLIPILVMSFYLTGKIAHYTAAGIFIFASITDFLDGYLARTWRAQSNFGRVLDPIADKLLVAATLMMLVHLSQVDVLPALAILCREILVSGLREYLAEIKVAMPVSRLSKVKTGVQMVAIVILLLGDEILGVPHIGQVGRIAIWIAALLTLVTGYAYLKKGLQHIN
ncbi:MAG: CDP-diacylglycerol--glycerol-3-phosphate 3-phosphatidyltransferase [Proteobacteria bacterium]|nr:CDP-diacylglycerol--glycerol-3-phosphate 3-phosphatidyltransferase [Pseudomonadota bacterium]